MYTGVRTVWNLISHIYLEKLSDVSSGLKPRSILESKPLSVSVFSVSDNQHKTAHGYKKTQRSEPISKLSPSKANMEYRTTTLYLNKIRNIIYLLSYYIKYIALFAPFIFTFISVLKSFAVTYPTAFALQLAHANYYVKCYLHILISAKLVARLMKLLTCLFN